MEITNVFAQMAPEALGPTIVGTLIGLLIGSLIGAVFLRMATDWVCNINLPYGQAVTYVFAVGLLSNIVQFILGMFMPPGVLTGILGALVGLGIAGFGYGAMIKDNRGEPIGPGKGFLIVLMLFLIGIGIAVAIFVIFFAITMFTGVGR